MVDGKWFAPGSDLITAYNIREAVFGTREDALDPESWNVVVRYDEQPVGTGRIRWQEGAFWLDRIGVLPAWRGKKMGDLVLRLLLFKAQTHAAREVCLVCDASLTGFFSRLGFHEVPGSGDLVLMSIRGEDIDLDTCKNCNKANCPNRK